MIKATLSKSISVETPNKMGTAAKLSQLVAENAQVNIEAVWAAGHDGKGYFSMITENNQKAIEALKKDYPSISENEILVIYVSNARGIIEEVTNKISQAGLNIDYLYTTYIGDKPSIILSTNDNKKAYGLFGH